MIYKAGFNSQFSKIGRGIIKVTLSVVVVFSVFILISCFFGEQMHKISPLMEKVELEKALGKPDGYRKDNNFEIYSYYNKMISGWSYDKADYHFIFENGKLIQWGAGEIRQNKNTGAIILIPLNIQ